jgi:hypothetical protein
VRHDDPRCLEREVPTAEAVRGQLALAFE